LKTAIVGMGSIGSRHARILKERLGHDVFALRSNTKAEPNVDGIPEVYKFDELKKAGVTTAFICGPTNTHIQMALEAAKLGLHLFIEKPLSDKLDGIDELEDICRAKNLSTYVGYGLRFHPVIMHLKEFMAGKEVYHVRATCSSYLHRWRPDQTKPNYSSFKEQGGGVILDLSHEFDYVQYIFGPIAKITGMKGKRSSVTVDSEDFADALVTLQNGMPANVHIDFFSELNKRKIMADFKGGSIMADLLANEVVIRHGDREEIVRFTGERDDYLTAQSKYFFEHVGQAGMMNNITEAKSLLVKILEFRNGR
jgi:predicted dehydrogenase